MSVTKSSVSTKALIHVKAGSPVFAMYSSVMLQVQLDALKSPLNKIAMLVHRNNFAPQSAEVYLPNFPVFQRSMFFAAHQLCKMLILSIETDIKNCIRYKLKDIITQLINHLMASIVY